MNLEDIKEVLEKKFNENPGRGKERHIIFWFDPEGEFENNIDDLEIKNAEIWRLKDNNNFITKYQLEVEDKESNYLIYSPKPMPKNRNNWLLDTVKYSRKFSADKTTVIMRDFGVEDRQLRPAFEKYSKFFNNKKRYNRLKNYNMDNFNEYILDEAIFSALCKLKTPDLEMATKNLLMESLNEEDNDIWERIEKFGSIDSVWDMLEKKFGYIQKDKSLKKFMLTLILTYVNHNLNTESPDNWHKYISEKETECVVFISQWMNHSKDSYRYKELAQHLETELNLEDYIDGWSPEGYIDCEAFEIFDKKIIGNLVDELLSQSEEYDKIKDVISSRRAKHWYEEFQNSYDAIYWTAELMELEKQEDSIKAREAEEFLELYTDTYHHFDEAYRKFFAAFDVAEYKSVLHEIKEEVKKLYSNWFLPKLSSMFSESLTKNNSWIIPGTQQQSDFYSREVKKFTCDNTKVFVIISDGLRYEAAAELEKKLNQKFKATTDLSYMQGSLPSTTSVGMASLLPNKKIEFIDKGTVLVDGYKSNSSKNREEIISSYIEKPVVLKADEVLEMTRDKMREEMYGKDLIYIYHNKIDAIGDNSNTEDEVFSAVGDAITEIQDIVKSLINYVSATNILITSDHGFLYRRGEIRPSDKTIQHPEEKNNTNKRFFIINEYEEYEGCTTINLGDIFDTEKKYVVVPKGDNVFQSRGGTYKYVHGGASLQEVVIPVINFKNDRSKSDRNIAKKVSVELTTSMRKITNSIFRLEFLQKEKISEERKPRRLMLYFEDEKGNKISNENIIIADSKSKNPEERTYKEKFTLKNRSYETDENYYLVMEDEEESVETTYNKIAFRISLAIDKNFDF